MENFTEQQVTLPDSVEALIDSICLDQNQPPPASAVRQKLAAIGEERASFILRKISKTKVKYSLGGLILYMINNPSSPSSSPSKSPFSTPPPPISTNGSPCSATRRSSSHDHHHQGAFGFGTTHSPVAELQQNPSYFYAERREENSLSPELVALGELEFRKAFLLLSYIGGESLENAINADKIRSLRGLPMGRFEKEIWEAVGKKYLSSGDRRSYVEWDSGKPHEYHCNVSTDGSLRFKGPLLLHNTRTHLQKSLGDDNVLIVKFAEERNAWNQKTTVEEANALYGKFAKEGIRVGLRLYRFFVFKDGGKEEKKKDPTTSPVKCYFVRMESYSAEDERVFYILSKKTMFEARSLFMHVHMLSSMDKYMARLSLILSKTFTLKIDLENVDVQTIEDVYCQDEDRNIVYNNEKPHIHTDGTGFISEDLAVHCPSNVFKGIPTKNKNMMEISNLVALEDMNKAMGEGELRTRQPPLLIQCRLFHMGRAIKGTLLVNKKLPPKTIQVRPSMVKVETDLSLQHMRSINSMEVVGTSNHPNRAYLSKYLIALLSYGGVPNDFFMDALQSEIEDADKVFSNKRAAVRVAVNHGEMDDYIVAGMILCGIPLDEPHLQNLLSIFAKEEKKRLKGGKLYVSDCFYLMGTVDPTGCLKRNEVCIIHENGQITGDVLVYRNPGLHFGDIHVMHARYVDKLESYVGHSKYGIFFPCVGPRSVADEIATGDFDGDMYWVSKNPQLLHYFKKSDPWIESPLPCSSVSKKPSDFSPVELEEELFKLFLKARFQPSNTIGAAADSWMALMDRLLTLRNDCTKEREKEHVKENILKLIDIYYWALDAPKSGAKIQVPKDLAVELFPHYMERERSFTSTSVLGLIYDEVCRWQSNNNMSGIEIKKLSCFDVEIPMSCMEKWETLYTEYRKDMQNALDDKSKSKDELAEIIKFYKQKLYGADNMEDSPKDIIDIYNEALAVYHATYNYAIQQNDAVKCSFAWRVAGSALMSLYTIKQNQRALTCCTSVLREIFG